jgi:hypothetical protein
MEFKVDKANSCLLHDGRDTELSFTEPVIHLLESLLAALFCTCRAS